MSNNLISKEKRMYGLGFQIVILSSIINSFCGINNNLEWKVYYWNLTSTLRKILYKSILFINFYILIWDFPPQNPGLLGCSRIINDQKIKCAGNTGIGTILDILHACYR